MAICSGGPCTRTRPRIGSRQRTGEEISGASKLVHLLLMTSHATAGGRPAQHSSPIKGQKHVVQLVVGRSAPCSRAWTGLLSRLSRQSRTCNAGVPGLLRQQRQVGVGAKQWRL